MLAIAFITKGPQALLSHPIVYVAKNDQQKIEGFAITSN